LDSHCIPAFAVFVPTGLFSASTPFTPIAISDPPISQEFGADSASGEMSVATAASIILVAIVIIFAILILAVVFRRKCERSDPKTIPSTEPDGTSTELASTALDDSPEILSVQEIIYCTNNNGSDAVPFEIWE
jgi:hypothetical protein